MSDTPATTQQRYLIPECDPDTEAFSLTCFWCDATEDATMRFPLDALVAGWENLSYDPEGFSWNYLGDCPDCIREGQPR